ncbi:PREDICTED: uncharacterized protein LOC101632315 [Condylura cristata]|uniref:uncharacterized protein LOC101632315 n=1 Tax=Condylura cristata TaxID=143302 RepID=UPI0006429B2C|nr:PREDICTED: uncharacterized protein LOC101632315 [Condylura cristata]
MGGRNSHPQNLAWGAQLCGVPAPREHASSLPWAQHLARWYPGNVRAPYRTEGALQRHQADLEQTGLTAAALSRFRVSESADLETFGGLCGVSRTVPAHRPAAGVFILSGRAAICAPFPGHFVLGSRSPATGLRPAVSALALDAPAAGPRSQGQATESLGRGGSQAEPAFVDRFGFSVATCCGYLAQVNDWQEDWVAFYARQRIQPQMDMVEKGSGDREALELWAALQRKIPGLFRDLDIVPALLHGDLWSGNVAEDASGPVIFDPASFYGHSEYELAIAGMFGGFSSSFYAAYHAQIPKAPGFETRLRLYQLFHYLNHWNHFGSGYRGSALSIMRDLTQTAGLGSAGVCSPSLGAVRAQEAKGAHRVWSPGGSCVPHLTWGAQSPVGDRGLGLVRRGRTQLNSRSRVSQAHKPLDSAPQHSRLCVSAGRPWGHCRLLGEGAGRERWAEVPWVAALAEPAPPGRCRPRRASPAGQARVATRPSPHGARRSDRRRAARHLQRPAPAQLSPVGRHLPSRPPLSGSGERRAGQPGQCLGSGPASAKGCGRCPYSAPGLPRARAPRTPPEVPQADTGQQPAAQRGLAAPAHGPLTRCPRRPVAQTWPRSGGCPPLPAAGSRWGGRPIQRGGQRSRLSSGGLLGGALPGVRAPEQPVCDQHWVL